MLLQTLKSEWQGRGIHEEDTLLHVLRKATDARLSVQRLAVVNDVDVASQRSQVPCGVMMQVLYNRMLSQKSEYFCTSGT
jgi:hypothetical protein